MCNSIASHCGLGALYSNSSLISYKNPTPRVMPGIITLYLNNGIELLLSWVSAIFSCAALGL